MPTKYKGAVVVSAGNPNLTDGILVLILDDKRSLKIRVTDHDPESGIYTVENEGSDGLVV